MLPSYHTLETITRARIDDIVQDADQHRLARQTYECSEARQHEEQPQASDASWLQRLAIRIGGSRA